MTIKWRPACVCCWPQAGARVVRLFVCLFSCFTGALVCLFVFLSCWCPWLFVCLFLLACRCFVCCLCVCPSKADLISFVSVQPTRARLDATVIISFVKSVFCKFERQKFWFGT